MCMDILPTCMSLDHVHAVPSNVRREYQIPGPELWMLGASLWVWCGYGVEWQSSGRTIRAFNF